MNERGGGEEEFTMVPPPPTTNTGSYNGGNKSSLVRKIVPFSEEQVVRIQKALDEPVDAATIQFRPSAQGSVAYVEGWKALSLANEVFGFNGWSSEILTLTTDFVDMEGGRISLGVSCMVRIHLRDGTFHDDIGYGSAENQKSKVQAYEKARKEAVTDAMKRALRVFGNRLGNCAYDKAFLRKVKAAASRPTGGGASNETLSNRPLGPPTTFNSIRMSPQAPPIDFTPSWQHPKTAAAANNVSLLSEADSELIVTEEQLLEFGSFFSEKIEDSTTKEDTCPPPPTTRQKTHHHHPSYRSEFRTGVNMPTVSMPLTQFRPPNSRPS